jgi:hypothetical protein
MGPVPQLSAGTMLTIFGKFLTLFLASLVLGAAAGLFSAIMLKRFNVSSTPQVQPPSTPQVPPWPTGWRVPAQRYNQPVIA